MLVAFSVSVSGAPIPADPSDPEYRPDSLHDAVAAAVQVVEESGLPHRSDAMFTTIEGEWDEVMDVVRRACEAIGRFGPRVSLVLKADIRPGMTGELTGKVDRLRAALARAADATDA
ncbi:thiamine-binding protein [Propionicicella superfundia]|uniref:thiamine-binding protein n=1 Tax=Propionicicella superfundia TaxID=348582 RepID=UPI0004025E1C|nr:thiamine-binding protein [Propionicicella superfundia]